MSKPAKQDQRMCKGCLSHFYRRPKEKRRTFENRDYCVVCEELYIPPRNNRPVKLQCPQCGNLYYITQSIDGHCSARCRDAYKREMDIRTAYDVLAYMREEFPEILNSGPVKTLTMEEIAAIAGEITPLDQISKGIVAAYKTSWMI